jgi:zinc protease
MSKSRLAAAGLVLVCAGFAQDAAPTTVEQVIERYIAAAGGREAMAKVKSSVSKGTFELQGLGATGTITLYGKAPNLRLTVLSIEGFGEILQGFDGKAGWSVNPQGSMEMSGQMLEEAKRDAVFHGELAWKELFPKSEFKGKEKLGEREAWVVVLTPAAGKPITAYYDAETFLPVKTVSVRATEQGESEVTTETGDYRTVEGGLKSPFLIRQKLQVGVLVVKLDEVKTNVEIEDKKFSRPPGEK